MPPPRRRTPRSSRAAAHPTVKAVNFFDSISPKGYDFRLVANAALLTAFTNLGHEANMGAMP